MQVELTMVDLAAIRIALREMESANRRRAVEYREEVFDGHADQANDLVRRLDSMHHGTLSGPTWEEAG